jgi:uncharacterized protein YkwD
MKAFPVLAIVAAVVTYTGCSGPASQSPWGASVDDASSPTGASSGSSGSAAGSTSGSSSSGGGSNSGSGGATADARAPADATASSSSSGGHDAASTGSSSGPSDASAANCPAPPATESAASIKAVNDTNTVRAQIGSPCATLVPALDTSAQKHCDYYAASGPNSSCTSNAHVEVSGCPNFVAANFGTRESKAGYAGQPSYEVMDFAGNPDQAVQTWIDSVWHRIPMLSPWVRDMGYGGTTSPAKCDTIDFGLGASTPSSVTAVYPYNGQTGVPTSFNGMYEGPMPPAPPASWPSGYPVILYLRGGTVQSHQITVDGMTAALPHVWIDGTNSTNSPDDYILYTNTPLTPNTTYHVQIAATQGSSQLTFDWKFTTGAR